jgi:hypothetical protein
MIKIATHNNKFNLCPGELLYAPFLQINYVSAWAEISATKRAQLKLAKRQAMKKLRFFSKDVIFDASILRFKAH